MVKYTSNRKQVIQAMDNANKMMLKAVGMAGATHVKQVIQAKNLIDEGNLLGSIDHQVDETGVYVGSKLTSEEYPIYLEKSTSNIQGKEYLRPGIMNNLGNLRQVAERNYKL
ncbi:hypothetical protein [Sediminibacillus massiliensis]|uniref:hypothetical protein n=1 Tax=Sediminibacillus massiliensis TaxID=1926277 RepID=UPI00098869BB|nr:hypothetical protein [Sediminibacillus massiliensis]